MNMLNISQLYILILILTLYNIDSVQDNKYFNPSDTNSIITSNKASSIQQTANFIVAYNRTMKFEGGYTNDPDDNGGETYRGISRKNNSQWSGWKIIDKYKHEKDFPKLLTSLSKLELMVQEFYKKNYWNKMHGDEISNQDIANQLFDKCVNMGVFQGIQILQNALGVKQTGKMDNATLHTLNSLTH